MSGDSEFGAGLLPAAHESLRCAVFSEQIALDPVGTALRVDELIVVDVARPWPKPVWGADGFTAVPEWVLKATGAGRLVRVLAAVPEDGRDHRLVVYRRVPGEGEMRRTEHRGAPESIVDLLKRLLLEGLDASPATVVEGPGVDRELLICAQGSHDVCCGSRGTEFAAKFAAARPEVEVRMVSHTGGHRFAPTGISLPDGRMWGLISLEEMLAVIDREGRPSDIVSKCRGWMGAEGPGQVAERAVFAAIDGWWFDGVERSVEVEAAATGWRCLVHAEGQTWEVHVAPGRPIPEISCGQPGGGVVKPGMEYVVRKSPRVAV